MSTLSVINVKLKRSRILDLVYSTVNVTDQLIMRKCEPRARRIGPRQRSWYHDALASVHVYEQASIEPEGVPCYAGFDIETDAAAAEKQQMRHPCNPEIAAPNSLLSRRVKGG